MGQLTLCVLDLTTMSSGHHSCGSIEHRTEVVRPRNSASPVAMPIRTGNSSARCAATAASTADLGDANAAATPSATATPQPSKATNASTVRDPIGV
jgi:hypothetical protein